MITSEDWVKEGFETTRLPYRWHSPSYDIVELDNDSCGFQLFSIISNRYDSSSYRGRLFNMAQFREVFMLIKEDYDLTDSEVYLMKPGV